MNIEEVAQENPEAIITEPVDITKGKFCVYLYNFQYFDLTYFLNRTYKRASSLSGRQIRFDCQARRSR